MAQQANDDDLFSPSLAGARRGQLPAGKRPWRLSSQFYVSVLGGPVAAGLVGFVNGQRLGLPDRRLAAIAGVALAALAAAVATIAAVDSGDNSPVRAVLMVCGALAYLAIRELQKDADRRYAAGAARGPDEGYDSLWLPGVLMVVGGLLLAAAVTLAAIE